jgi:hypothetical protein
MWVPNFETLETKKTTAGKDQILKFVKTAALLKKTSSKNTIMKEAKEIFYDKEFYSKLNTNNYLIDLVQKGAKNTLQISNDRFLSKKFILPLFEFFR